MTLFEAVSGRRHAWGPLGVAALTTALAVALSHGLPEAHAATGVGLLFLVVTYALVLRHADAGTAREFGLSLGGLFEPEPIAPRRLLAAAGRAGAFAALAALLIFPPFWLGFLLWNDPRNGFVAAPAPALNDQILGQLFGVAFPEEVFFRGYLQSALDRAWPVSTVFSLSPGILVSSAVFALGHFLTEPRPERLAVFFPSLVFGILRKKSGGVGAPIAFHAACNLFAAYLAESYGLS